MAHRPSALRPIRAVLTMLSAAFLLGCAAITKGPDRPGPNVTACPVAAPTSLAGLWALELPASGERWTLQLAPHPEHMGSWRGQIAQGQRRFAVVADLDDGDFTMEESHDGRRIAATWLGQWRSGACLPLIEGERLSDQAPAQAFVMRAKGP